MQQCTDCRHERPDRARPPGIAHDGPALVDVVTDKHELAMPPKIELAHELARTNLR